MYHLASLYEAYQNQHSHTTRVNSKQFFLGHCMELADEPDSNGNNPERKSEVGYELAEIQQYPLVATLKNNQTSSPLQLVSTTTISPTEQRNPQTPPSPELGAHPNRNTMNSCRNERKLANSNHPHSPPHTRSNGCLCHLLSQLRDKKC